MKTIYFISFILLSTCLSSSACNTNGTPDEPNHTETRTEQTKAEKQATEMQQETIKDGGNSQEQNLQEQNAQEATPEPFTTDLTPKETTPKETTPKESKMTCTFNQNCPAQMRCECDEKIGCFCVVGTRGKGVSGVDTCKNGNDCKTALCIEGNGGKFYCSGTCQTDKDCLQALPICSNISFVGKVCIRKRK